MYDKLIAEKCVEDASEYIWLRLDARSFWLVNRRVSNWIVFSDNSDCFLKCLWFICSMRIMMDRALVYDKLINEKCVEDASEYIWLRWYARSVLIGKSQGVKLNCVPR